jgi:glycosyltransferase involved in cell wall biosynthesis
MKNILFASWYTDLGGGETALLALAGALDPARCRLHLLVPREGRLAERWRANGWPVHSLAYRGASLYFIPALWARLPVVGRMERLLRDHDIHATHSDYHTLPMLLPAAEWAGVPVLWTCMGWWFRPKPWQRAFFRRPAAAFAHSQAIKNGFLGQPPFMPPERIEVLYPGVDAERFHPGVDGAGIRHEAGIPPDAPVVALVARFQDVKGHEVFQDMARRVVREVPAAYFLVAGENIQTGADSAYKRRILQAAQDDPDLRGRLIYLGFRADVERVLAAADVVVCSSFFESYGLVNVEAMACGRPVVSTNRGGPAETVVHGETGFLTPPGDAGALAFHVVGLLRDPALRARLGAAGRTRVERLFSARANGRQFTRQLEQLLGR